MKSSQFMKNAYSGFLLMELLIAVALGLVSVLITGQGLALMTHFAGKSMQLLSARSLVDKKEEAINLPCKKTIRVEPIAIMDEEGKTSYLSAQWRITTLYPGSSEKEESLLTFIDVFSHEKS